MMGWQSIEELVPDSAIWVIKYSLYYLPDGNWCNADHPDAIKLTDCHGWYETEAEARQVLNHFPLPNSYRIERVWKRKIKESS